MTPDRRELGDCKPVAGSALSGGAGTVGEVTSKTLREPTDTQKKDPDA
jgi:hypothetical protein